MHLATAMNLSVFVKVCVCDYFLCEICLRERDDNNEREEELHYDDEDQTTRNDMYLLLLFVTTVLLLFFLSLIRETKKDCRTSRTGD